MRRSEFKYILSFNQYVILKDRLLQFFEHDRAQQVKGSYPVFTCYLDTPELALYHQKIEGEQKHLKVRIRRYATGVTPEDNVLLEIKSKDVHRQLKLRAQSVPFKTAINPSLWDHADPPIQPAIIAVIEDHQLLHSCNLYYEREAFESFHEQNPRVRINFDREIVALYPREMKVTQDLLERRRILPDNRILLEIKVDGEELPRYLLSLISDLDIAVTSFSKYTTALEFLNCASSME